jgi:hypothetical protein
MVQGQTWAQVDPLYCGVKQKNSFHLQIGLKFKLESGKVLCLEHSFVWCSDLDTSESRSEIYGMF